MKKERERVSLSLSLSVYPPLSRKKNRQLNFVITVEGMSCISKQCRVSFSSNKTLKYLDYETH